MYLDFFFLANTILIASCRYVETGEFLAEVKFGGKTKVDWFHFPSKHFCSVLIFACSCGVPLGILGDELDSLWETHRFTSKKFIFCSLLEDLIPNPT